MLKTKKLENFQGHLDIEREKEIAKMLNERWAKIKEEEQKPIDIMAIAKEKLYGYNGEDYSYGSSYYHETH